MKITNPSNWKEWSKTFPAIAPKDATYVSPFRVVNKSADAAEVLIYDHIGRDFWSGEGMAANDFANILKDIAPNATLTVGINSPGGNVWDGLAIHNMLAARPGKTITRNDGMAASIASVILQAGSERQSNSSSLVMIHKAWGMMVGNADDAEQFRKDLAKHDQVIAELYAKRSGLPVAGFEAAMSAETTYTGEEAKTAGLVDKITVNNLGDPAGQLMAPAQMPVAAASPHTLTAPAANPGVLMNAAGNTNQPKGNLVMPDQIPAAINPPAPDLSPILDAIKDLKTAIKPTELPGTAPVALGIENLGSPLKEKYARLEPGAARMAFRLQHHQDLMKLAPQNANTIDTALVPDYMSDALITVLNNRLANLSAWSFGIGLNPLAPRQTVQVSLASAGSTTLVNGTNFEAGDSTLDGQPVTVDQYSQPFHLTNAQINQGIMIGKLATVNANALANKLSDVVTALMIVGNFGATTVIGTAAAFDYTKLKPILALAKNYAKKQLLLDGGHLAYLLPADRNAFKLGEQGAFGFDLLLENNRWTGATANTAGFVASPDAICYATGTPLNLPSAEFLSQAATTLVNGIPVTGSSWYSRGSRTVWMCYDVMFGAGVGDATAAEVLVTV
jgi:ATP-dependent Clp protease protease subunit